MIRIKVTHEGEFNHMWVHGDDAKTVTVEREGFEPQHIIIDQMKPVVKKCFNERCFLNNQYMTRGCERLPDVTKCRLYNLYGKGDGK